MALGDNRIAIVGCGPGSLDYVTPAALKAIEEAELLAGAKRLLDLFPSTGVERLCLETSVPAFLDQLEARAGAKRTVVLVSGDPGVFSLARHVIRRFGRDKCRVVPGISSLQVAFARLGLDWADARIVSAHQRDPEPGPEVLRADKVAVFGGREGLGRWIAANWLKAPCGLRFFLCEDLTLDGERVREVAPEALASLGISPRGIVLIIKGSLLS
jgi:cobalt-precorrin-7 (C5)-methyltransferase